MNTSTFIFRIPFLIYIAVFLISIPEGRSQTLKRFSDEPVVFIEELTTLMTQRITSEDEILFNEFLTLFQSGAFAEDEQFRVIVVSNMMLQKKARPYPHFRNYLISLIHIKKRSLPSEDYIAWEKGLMDLLENKQYSLSNINRFFTITQSSITDKLLFQSSPATWKATVLDFRMVYDSSLYFLFPKTTLICFAQRDSIQILETSGRYHPATLMWYGNGGKVTWERAGYESNRVYAQLGNYSIDMTKPNYEADSILFTHSGYFSSPIPGKLSDRARRVSSPSQASFPVFNSYASKFSIKNLYKNIDYEGGLSMEGSTIKGTGDEFVPAKLLIYSNDTLRMIVQSNSLQIRGDRIRSSENIVTLYLENDSIFHPTISFTYSDQNREITLSQSENLITHSPYYNSYHDIDMNFDQLIWKIDEPEVKLTMARGASQGQGRFRSINFFNKIHFDGLQGMDIMHPLFALKKFSEWYYSEEFPVSELARWLNYPEYQVQRLMAGMAMEGFIFYDAESGMITMKPQLFDYLNANAGVVDYDVIDFISNVQAPQDNARLNLNSKELTIFGIPRIFISDSQNVEIVPAGNKITLKKNRDFNFGGNVSAGLLSFYGQNFSFKYDSFRIDLENIESLSISVIGDSVDIYGNPELIRVENNIENITGQLFIDHPSNKSGLEDFPEYPQFKSTANSFVYYDDVTAGMDSVLYPQDAFYYKLNPFEINDLTNLTPDNISFSGEFIAGEIFPSLKQELIMQEDMSLGFKVSVPPEGLSTYDGKAIFYDEVSLSNEGIHGNGRLEYLGTSIQSEDFIFYPDSMLGNAQRFTLERDSIEGKYPHIDAFDVAITWFPNEDQMHIDRIADDLEIFNKETTFRGNLTLSSNAIVGEGTIYLANSEIESKEIEYGDVYFHADTADFRIKSEDGPGYSMIAGKVNTNVNLEEQEGFFNAQVDTLPIKFPEKNYLSSADLIVWNMEFDRVDIVNQDERNDSYKLGAYLSRRELRNAPTFVSTNPGADSLAFKSDSAVYKLDDHTLSAYYVDFIEVADARIFPGGRSLTLEKTGSMKGFTNARIIANDVHTLDAEKINILSRKKYYGSGFYNYVDEDKGLQRIRFADITVDKNGHTHAEGEITQTDSFRLSPYFDFEGQVVLDAERQYLEFTGAVKLLQNCPTISNNLIAFTAEIDPENVRIPIPSQPAAPNGVRIYNGIYITTDSTHIYSAYFSKRKNYSDIQIASSEGFLSYNKATGQYRIASEEKLANPDSRGNLLALDKNYCKLKGEGQLNLSVDLGQLSLNSVGLAEHDIEANVTEIDLLLGMNFFFSEEALQLMAQEINAIPTLRPVDMSRRSYTIGMNELLQKQEGQNVQDETLLLGMGQVATELKHSLFISELKMKWNDETSSFISDGEIGIGNINGIPMNKKVDGFIEIQKRRTGDIMDVFLQIDERTWYYFGYTRGVMQAYSSNRNFREILVNTNNNDRRQKVASGETSYIYMVASDRKYSNFRRRMLMIQEGDVINEDVQDEF